MAVGGRAVVAGKGATTDLGGGGGPSEDAVWGYALAAVPVWNTASEETLLLMGASGCLAVLMLLSRVGMGAGGEGGWVLLLLGEGCTMVGMALPSGATRGALVSGGSFLGSGRSTFLFNSPGSSRGMGWPTTGISFDLDCAGEVTVSTGDGWN